MQLELMPDDYSDKRVLISLSGGIDSMALLCYLASIYPAELRPKQVFIMYVHIREHSPKTARFVIDGIRYAQRHFESVTWKIHRAGSVLDFFAAQRMIPHPMFSPCSEQLKMIPINRFKDEHQIEVDMVAFLRGEKNRMRRSVKKGGLSQGKVFLINHLLQQDVFALVDREIGWHPPIYDIRRDDGTRVFKHNNCLPCKNMAGRLDDHCATGEFAETAQHYPQHIQDAMSLSAGIGSHWGRDKNDEGHCGFCEA